MRPSSCEVLDESGKSRIDDRVRAESGEHPAAPAAGLHLAVVPEIVERALRRRQRLDVEPLKQRARPELGTLQAGGDVIVGLVGVPGAEALMEAEDFREGVVEPEPGRRAAEQMKVVGEAAPDLAWIGFYRAAVGPRHAQVLETRALTVEHAMHVVVGNDEQPCRVGEGSVVGEPSRVGVAVRTDDRQLGDRSVEVACYGARFGLGGEKPVWVERERRRGNGHGRSLRVNVFCDGRENCRWTFRQIGLMVKW